MYAKNFTTRVNYSNKHIFEILGLSEGDDDDRRRKKV